MWGGDRGTVVRPQQRHGAEDTSRAHVLGGHTRRRSARTLSPWDGRQTAILSQALHALASTPRVSRLHAGI